MYSKTINVENVLGNGSPRWKEKKPLNVRRLEFSCPMKHKLFMFSFLRKPRNLLGKWLLFLRVSRHLEFRVCVHATGIERRIANLTISRVAFLSSIAGRAENTDFQLNNQRNLFVFHRGPNGGLPTLQLAEWLILSSIAGRACNGVHRKVACTYV